MDEGQQGRHRQHGHAQGGAAQPEQAEGGQQRSPLRRGAVVGGGRCSHGSAMMLRILMLFMRQVFIFI
jgi:hypothetical protein